MRAAKAKKLQQVKVLRRVDVTSELLKMWIERPEGFTFKPGQYCTIGIDGIERAYSIVSAPYEKDLELFVELVPKAEGGMLTPLIWDLHKGDTVSIRPRGKGVFVFKPEWRNHMMVATVTGIVPYVSIARQYLHDLAEWNEKAADHHIYVLMGASYADEFVYNEELSVLAGELPDLFTFVPTISRPGEPRNNGWTGQTGRANQVVEEYLDLWSLATEDTLIYACGHPRMIEDVKDRCVPQGYSVEKERFWKQD
jgi:NAD(P)H-flavin reductase